LGRLITYFRTLKVLKYVIMKKNIVEIVDIVYKNGVRIKVEVKDINV